MQERKHPRDFDRPSDMTGTGMQGIDKAPGEEPARGTENPVWVSQKGKKVDGDPSEESDKPVDKDLSGNH